MPTGYTEVIGKGASFEQFALRCARAKVMVSSVMKNGWDT